MNIAEILPALAVAHERRALCRRVERVARAHVPDSEILETMYRLLKARGISPDEIVATMAAGGWEGWATDRSARAVESQAAKALRRAPPAP
jgi:hypothetical protein